MSTNQTTPQTTNTAIFSQGADFYDPNNPNGWHDRSLGYHCQEIPFLDSTRNTNWLAKIKNYVFKKLDGLYAGKVMTLPEKSISVAAGNLDLKIYNTYCINDCYHELRSNQGQYAAHVFALGLFLFFFLFLGIKSVSVIYELLFELNKSTDDFYLFLFISFACLVFCYSFLIKIIIEISFGNAGVRFYKTNKKIYFSKRPNFLKVLLKPFKTIRLPFDESINWDNTRTEIYRHYLGHNNTNIILTMVLIDPNTNIGYKRIEWLRLPFNDLSSALNMYESMRRYMQGEIKEVPLISDHWTAPKKWQRCFDLINPLTLLFNRGNILNQTLGRIYHWGTTGQLGSIILKVFDIPLCIILWLATPITFYFVVVLMLVNQLKLQQNWKEIDQECAPEPFSYAAKQLSEMYTHHLKQEHEENIRHKMISKWLYIRLLLWLGSYSFLIFLFVGR